MLDLSVKALIQKREESGQYMNLPKVQALPIE